MISDRSSGLFEVEMKIEGCEYSILPQTSWVLVEREAFDTDVRAQLRQRDVVSDAIEPSLQAALSPELHDFNSLGIV